MRTDQAAFADAMFTSIEVVSDAALGVLVLPRAGVNECFHFL
jgi:hypothetical protein